jgi:hypothetical protein
LTLFAAGSGLFVRGGGRGTGGHDQFALLVLIWMQKHWRKKGSLCPGGEKEDFERQSEQSKQPEVREVKGKEKEWGESRGSKEMDMQCVMGVQGWWW